MPHDIPAQRKSRKLTYLNILARELLHVAEELHFDIPDQIFDDARSAVDELAHLLDGLETSHKAVGPPNLHESSKGELSIALLRYRKVNPNASVRECTSALQNQGFEVTQTTIQELLPQESKTTAPADQRRTSRKSKQPQTPRIPRPKTKGARKSASDPKRDRRIADLRARTPALDKEDGTWVKNTHAAHIEGLESATLRKYRLIGITTSDKTLGCDNDGRIWRRQGTLVSHPWYLRSTLKAQQKK